MKGFKSWMRRTGCSDRLIYDEKLLLEYIAATFPDVKEIVFEDDTFTMKKDRVLEICRLMREKGLNRRFRWLCNARVNLDLEMQKDFIIQNFQSVKLDPTQTQQKIHVVDAVRTQIFTASGEVFDIEGGYLDIGILDTMKDLLVNFIGAIVFCVFGFIYLHSGSKGKVSGTVIEGLRIQPAAEHEEETAAETAEAAEAEMAEAAEAEPAAESEEITEQEK